ncbi:rhodanese-like domain-containing protein [Xanthobacter sp. TB0139]|uniref:rhodanese-like domain-containing protein n=1 Tax=Xanthobacter sp. TB0139 TaxID=3459178 RepID=UPI004039D24F
MATLISAQDLHRKLEQGALTLLDVRSPGEFARAHVPQAINAPLTSLDPAALEQLGTVNRKKTLYLMCQTQGRSGMAATHFEKAGFRKVVIVAGGMAGWKAAGLAINTAPGAATTQSTRYIAIAIALAAGLTLAWLI